MTNVILEAKNLIKYFPVKRGGMTLRVDWLHAVDDISFKVHAGEVFGMVGESGCGKSTTRKLLLRMLEPDSGSVLYRGQNIFKLKNKEMASIRKKLQVVFQDPYSSLDPKWRVGDIIAEPLRVHGIGDVVSRKKKVLELMQQVGLRPEQFYRFPHEFSGGQRQRIGIARALALEPEVIIADEPVSALDVSIQAQIINLFKKLKNQMGLTYVFISHDLSVVKHICDRVAVMYLGQIVEIAPTSILYESPRHPYTQALLSAIPIPDPVNRKEVGMLEGEVPSPINPPPGCCFNHRCKQAREECFIARPVLVEIEKGHEVCCHLYG